MPIALPTNKWQPVTNKTSARVTAVPIYNWGIRRKCDESREEDSHLLLLFWFSNYWGAHDHSSHAAFSKQHAKHVCDTTRDSFDKMDSHYTCTAFAKDLLKQSGLGFQHMVLFKVAQKCIKQLVEKLLTSSLWSFHGRVSNSVVSCCPSERTWKKSCVSSASK